MKTPEPELLPSPHDGSKVKFCDECDSGCHRIIGNGIEIDLLPTIRQGDSLENRRAICAERWNARVYPPRFIPETPAQVLEWLCSNYRSYEAFPDPQDDTYTLTAHDILSAFSWWDEDEYPPDVQAAIERDAPKKLIFPTVKKKSEEKEDMPRCPACEKLLGKVAGRTRHTYPCKDGARTIECNLYEWDVQTFCPECGQRLDWSEE